MPITSPRPPQFPLRVGKSANGFGLFAVEDIPKGRFIIEYWGKVVPDAVADKVAGRYLFDLENGNTILGSTRKNIARYINHACRPNAEARGVGNRLFIYSTKRIKAGEEVSYNYGKDYFTTFIKPYGCRCKTCLKRR
jgi:SET domain-containing protein